jgi:polyferredoxin/tetratricopeptide (TPR) repeat protein
MPPAGKTTNQADHCTKTTVSLPVLPAAPARKSGKNAWSSSHATIAHSKTGRWRAMVLVLVHVLIAAHVVQWLITGMTLSPVEPSESMQTLRQGIVNAGFVFFLLAIASTLILGRFFCGWACHVVALQDLCSWIMTKLRVKPKPFRSRLLVYVPLILALYMFVWPVVHRTIVRPIFADETGRLPVWLGQSETLPGVMTDFIVDDFWATFPPWYVAIPFLLLIGFGSVYFLGSKGFCTYGCPYGGFFGPADLVAPGKIRVTDACHHCGHCTAVCTSNVRVHEEVRDFGMVVDPGCMKCMDCVSVCPNDALYFGFGTPTILAKPKDDAAKATAAKAKALRESRYDLSRREEWVAAALFLLLFLGYRGMGHLIPMLMAVGIAGIGTFLAWKSWTMLRPGANAVPNVRLQSLQLKYRGRIRGSGVLVLLSTVALVAVGGWGLYVSAQRYLAAYHYEHLSTPLSVVLRPDFEPTQRELDHARASLAAAKRAGSPAEGGVGWALDAGESLNLAYCQLLTGHPRGAEATLRRVIETGNPRESLVNQLVQLMRVRGAADTEIAATLDDALDRHPELDALRDQIARRKFGAGDATGALKLWDEVLHDKPVRPGMLLGRAALLLAMNKRDEALSLVDQALDRAEDADTVLQAAALLAQAGERDRAVALTRDAHEKALNPGSVKVAAAGQLAQLGQPDAAVELASLGVERVRQLGRHSSAGQAFLSAGMLLLSRGDTERGLALIREAAKVVGPQPWDLSGIGSALLQAGLQQGRREDLLRESVAVLERARDADPDSPVIRADLAAANYALGKFDAAVAEMTAAAEKSRTNPVIPQRLADLLRDRGRPAEAEKWAAEAARRAGAK